MPPAFPLQSRRQFLRTAVAVAGAAALHGMPAAATPMGLPLGIQLYSVRDMLAKDYGGTLKKLSSIGYREVEAAGFYDHTPDQVKAALAAAGLSMPSSHYSATTLQKSFDDVLVYGKALGLQYIVCSFPALRDPSRIKDQSHRAQVEAFTLDDYRFNASLFNTWGKQVKSAGMKFGYHNHTMEFTPLEGSTGFDEMMRLTDPELVSFEMDCGWVTVGGGNPVALLNKYPTRINMLHIKDFKATPTPASMVNPPPAAELGQGTVKFLPIFQAASRTGHVQHMFVEQEAYDIDPFQALQIDARYMQAVRG